MSDINPAEALIVVTGLEPFLRHTSRDLGSAIVRSEQLPATIEAKVYRFLGRAEREPTSDLPAFDYDETVALLDGPGEDIEKTLAAFGNQHELAMAVGHEVTRIHAYVQQQIPRRVHMTISGPEHLPPARSELFRFRRCWRVAQEPLSIFDELQEFALSRDQMKCFVAMFPTTAATLWPTIQQAIVRKGTTSEKWKPSRQKEILLRVLGQQEAPSLALAQALAPIYEQERATEQAQQAKQAGGKPPVSQADEATPVGRLDAAS